MKHIKWMTLGTMLTALIFGGSMSAALAEKHKMGEGGKEEMMEHMQPGKGYGRAHGMMGRGMGMMGYGRGMMGHGMEPMWMLDLSDEQLDKIFAIRRDLVKEIRPLMQQMMEQREKLHELYGAEKRDPSAIGEAYSKLADLKRQMIEARIKTHNRMEEVLSEEQRKQLKSMHQRMMRMGPMWMMEEEEE